jgi:hypothetical protein
MLRPSRRKADRENKAYTSLLRILTIIAPTLQTLAFHIQVSWTQLPFPPSLPALVELSIKHPFNRGYLRDEAFNCTAPSLRRLVLTGFRFVLDDSETGAGVVASIKRFAPSLTHLGVTTNSSAMRLLICLVTKGKRRNELFIHTLEDLVIEDALIGYPGNPQIFLAHRSGSQDQWKAWVAGMTRTGDACHSKWSYV